MLSKLEAQWPARLSHEYDNEKHKGVNWRSRLQFWLAPRLRQRRVQHAILRFLLLLAAIWLIVRLSSTRHHDIPHYRHIRSMITKASLKPSTTNAPSTSLPILHEHPIPKLIQEAELRWQAKLNRQSRTFRDAVHEYERRYKRKPPKGFDGFWEFSQQWNVIMVDEFGVLEHDLEPFRSMSGEEFRRRVAEAAVLPSFDLVRIRKGKVKAVNVQDPKKETGAKGRARGFAKLLSKFAHNLPDMDFVVNTLAEGRIVVPWEHRTYPNITDERSARHNFQASWGGKGNVWEAWRRSCPPDSPARRLWKSSRNFMAHKSANYLAKPPRRPTRLSTYDLDFETKTPSLQDYCSDPAARLSQGHFFSDWATIPTLHPVLSPAKAPGFLDINIPSHYYDGTISSYTYGFDNITKKARDLDPTEVPWKAKEDKIFWRGATTGGGSTPPGFAPNYQRHRFLRMTSRNTSENWSITFANSLNTSHYLKAPIHNSQLNDEIMDIAFVLPKAEKAYPGGLAAMKREYRFGDRVPLSRSWNYKYALDMDGMSYSGRFMALLASKSVPVKATLYKEFWTDWIEPWVHFIPLSLGYHELYNIYTYFSGIPDAALTAVNEHLPRNLTRMNEDDALEKIGEAGARWKRSIGRYVDMEAYAYRLALEYARLWSDDREAMTLS